MPSLSHFHLLCHTDLCHASLLIPFVQKMSKVLLELHAL